MSKNYPKGHKCREFACARPTIAYTQSYRYGTFVSVDSCFININRIDLMNEKEKSL